MVVTCSLPDRTVHAVVGVAGLQRGLHLWHHEQQVGRAETWNSYSGSQNIGPTLFSRRWQLSARACCTTLMASVAGGWVALVQSYIMNDKKQVTITHLLSCHNLLVLARMCSPW